MRVKKWKIKSRLALLLSFTLFLTGCGRFEYRGDYLELYSVAIHSILGQEGYRIQGGPFRQPPRIRILEEDNYGRVLFSYTESGEREHAISLYNLVIMQKVEGDYVYFYPHYNFISRDVGGSFTDAAIDALKEANSWNQPLSDRSEFERIRISRRKQSGPLSDAQLIEAFNEIFSRNITRLHGLMIYLRTDDYGRAVYLAEPREGYFAILFQPDHSFDLETGVLEITDRNNYQTELRLFMEANGWNTPFEE